MYKNNFCNNLKLDASMQQPKGLAAQRAERECLDLSATANIFWFCALVKARYHGAGFQFSPSFT